VRNHDDGRKILTLQVHKAGKRFGDRCNITLRMPEEWTPHHLLHVLLKGSGMFHEHQLQQTLTFADQLTLLKCLDGWHEVHTTGLVHEGFATRVSNALELIYFGVDPSKVCSIRSCPLHSQSAAIT
jgi:hypothetical protein